MMSTRRFWVALALCICPPAMAHADELILRDVNLVAIDDGTVVPHQSVVIRGSRIVSVSQASAEPASTGARVVIGSGKFLIPGLVEGHAHIGTAAMFRERRRRDPARVPDADLGAPYDFDQRILLQFLRFGVTSVFNYGSPTRDGGGLFEIRDAIASGRLMGPRLLIGKRIDGSRAVLLGTMPAADLPSSIEVPQTAEHARLAVLRAREQGYDFIKAYQHLNAETYPVLVRTAHELGLRVAGHLPEIGCAQCLRREQAFDTPLDAIAHLEELSRYAQQTDYAAEDLGYLTAIVRRSGASVVTTLVASRSIIHMYAYRALPPLDPQDRRLVDSVTLWSWLGPNNPYLQESFRRQPGAESFPAAYDYQRALARHLWKAGVPLVVGTDAPIPGVAYGSSVIDEMIELNKIGLRPHEVLQSATRNALRFLGEDGAGRIGPGARADLVLLDANPLEYIGNVREIAGVVAAGRWLPIERLRADSEAAVRAHERLDRQFKITRDRG
jgi:cytosine/adenosine deaminase-related metal-dependent hydrolase